MAKVELRITTCCCCSLTVAAILTTIYLFIFYCILLGLAAFAVSRIPFEGQEGSNYYSICRWEAEHKNGAEIAPGVTVVDASDTPYFCSLGLYTEELKFIAADRYAVLIIDILLYVVLVICAVVALVGIIISLHWLLLPCIAFLCLDIIRGTISVIFIFVLSYSSLVRIAVGIFFLGIQIFHISLVLMLIAKFQRIYDKRRGVDYKGENGEKSIMADGSHMYPTLPSHYAYSSSPHVRREGYYQPSYYNTYAGKEGGRVYRDRPPSDVGGQHPHYGRHQESGYQHQYSSRQEGRTM